MKTKKVKIELDKKNYRKHSDKNKNLINKSLKELGAGRSILIDSENEIIAGNGVYEQAESLGIPVKIIETDGTELIAIKRTDLKTDSDKRKHLALADNSISDTSEFDLDLLNKDFDKQILEDWGMDLPDINDGYFGRNQTESETQQPEQSETETRGGGIVLEFSIEEKEFYISKKPNYLTNEKFILKLLKYDK